MTNPKPAATKWCLRVVDVPDLRVHAAPARRALALAVIFGLGGLLLALVFVRPPAPGWAMFLVALGAGALWLAEAMRRGTRTALLLDRTGLRHEGGALIAAWDQIARIERGVLALKPAGGFTLVLRRRAARGWVPGMWWRLGRQVGVGGILRRPELRALADAIAARLPG